MLADECRKIYAYLFDGRICPAELCARYEQAHTDLKLQNLDAFPEDIGAAEFSSRRPGIPAPLTAKMKLVAYLAETTQGHYAIMHAPEPRNYISVFIDLGLSFVRAKIAKFRHGQSHGI